MKRLPQATLARRVPPGRPAAKRLSDGRKAAPEPGPPPAPADESKTARRYTLENVQAAPQIV